MTSHRRFERCKRPKTAWFDFVFTLAVENAQGLQNIFFAYNVFIWNLWLLNFGLLLNFRDITVTLSQNVVLFVSNTSQLIGLGHFIINDLNYLVFWKKLVLNQVLRFSSVSVYVWNQLLSYNSHNSGQCDICMKLSSFHTTPDTLVNTTYLIWNQFLRYSC